MLSRVAESIYWMSLDSLSRCHWPGNIRELENFIERSVILSAGKVLNAPLAELEQSRHGSLTPTTGGSVRATTLDECEREHIQHTLDETRWIVDGPNGAAARLGVKRIYFEPSLRRRLEFKSKNRSFPFRVAGMLSSEQNEIYEDIIKGLSTRKTRSICQR